MSKTNLDSYLHAGLGPRAAARRAGVSYDYAKQRSKALGCRAFAQPREEHHEAAALEAWNANDAVFCARVLALGGMPRAVVIAGRTLWLGPEGGLWYENKT
jgi:hypothetical protein